MVTSGKIYSNKFNQEQMIKTVYTSDFVLDVDNNKRDVDIEDDHKDGS